MTIITNYLSPDFFVIIPDPLYFAYYLFLSLSQPTGNWVNTYFFEYTIPQDL